MPHQSLAGHPSWGQPHPAQTPGLEGKLSSTGELKDLAFGIFRTPKMFIGEAVKAGHPISFENVLPPPTRRAVDYAARTSPKQRLGQAGDAKGLGRQSPGTSGG